MKLTQQEKNAIENLIILASYIEDHSIIPSKEKELIDRSVKVCEKLIGKDSKQKAEHKVSEIAKTLINEINKKRGS